jgi:hypothetical protein
MARAFISYSHRDEKSLDRLHTHLAMLRRDTLIAAWYDREILAGAEIDREVATNLAGSDLFLALLSPDFLASNYCYEKEMQVALQRHEEGSLRVIPIVLEPCDWKSSPLAKLKALPKDGKPISIWTNENVAYLNVITELRRLLTETAKPRDETTSPNKEIPATRLPPKRYRIKKEFDSIDRDEFRQKSFAAIEEFFRRSIDELNEIGDPIRARFEKVTNSEFSCTVLNKGAKNKEAYITIRSGGEGPFASAITHSYSRHASGVNGFITVEANEYELCLKSDGFGFTRSQTGERMSAEEAADGLWREFISHAGIDHE